jgi:hypothetical protein
MKATVANAKLLIGKHAGWANFKHRLIDHGIIKTADDDCPVEWQVAFLRACGRTHMAKELIKKSTKGE